MAAVKQKICQNCQMCAGNKHVCVGLCGGVEAVCSQTLLPGSQNPAAQFCSTFAQSCWLGRSLLNDLCTTLVTEGNLLQELLDWARHPRWAALCQDRCTPSPKNLLKPCVSKLQKRDFRLAGNRNVWHDFCLKDPTKTCLKWKKRDRNGSLGKEVD